MVEDLRCPLLAPAAATPYLERGAVGGIMLTYAIGERHWPSPAIDPLRVCSVCD